MRRLLNLILIPALILAFSAASVFAEDIPSPTQFGTAEMYSTATPGKVLKDSYYYSDEWFSISPEIENPYLALLSMQLEAAASSDDTDDLGGDMLKKLGFSDIHFTGNSDPAKIDCNYTYGTKTLGDGTTLVAVAVQGAPFDTATKSKGWNQNFTIAGESLEALDHYAFNEAANAVLDDIANINSGNVKYWITGHSRAGALASIIAAKLPEKLGSRNKDIYTYTFEAPAVTGNDPGDCSYIHNYISSDDLVTMVPPWSMKRYGVTHYFDDMDNAALQKSLQDIGSELIVTDSYSMGSLKELSSSVVAALESKISSQKYYGQDHSETIETDEGSRTIKYNYQKIFRTVSDLIFSGGLNNISSDTLMDHYDELTSTLKPYIEGYLIEKGKLESDKAPSCYYWTGAVGINKMLEIIWFNIVVPVSKNNKLTIYIV